MDKTPNEQLEELKNALMESKAQLKLKQDELAEALSTDEEAKQRAINRSHKKIDEMLSKVTPALFAQFLDERGASRTCLSCGSHRLSVAETSKVDESKLPENYTHLGKEDKLSAYKAAVYQHVSYSFIDDEVLPSLRNVKYRVNCKDCGFISFYRAWPIVQWVLDQEDGDKDE